MNNVSKTNAMQKTGANWPCGPCDLPLECSNCGTIITEENAVNRCCDDAEECEVCQYCGNGRCPNCDTHWHCGGCI